VPTPSTSTTGNVTAGRAAGGEAASAGRLEGRDEAAVAPDGRGTDLFPTVSVVVCAFAMRRWAYLVDAIEAVRSQSIRPVEAILVVDGNPELLERAQSELEDLRVIPNARGAGSSGARNTGAAASEGEIIVFLDDDIVVDNAWLETVLSHFTRPDVIGVGGAARPRWQHSCPAWLPPEFYWVVGASYAGMPEQVGPVRNVWSSNMAVRRGVFEKAGGFRDELAKVASKSRPDDTDLCLRAAVVQESGVWIYEPAALASHWVPKERAAFKYFVYRCYNEGVGKGALAAFNGLGVSTSVERRYIRHDLSGALGRYSGGLLTGQFSDASRIAATVAGLAVAVVGFLVGAGKFYLRRSRG
jgi:glycosyltransferase involved in cell wall biosynthesis